MQPEKHIEDLESSIRRRKFLEITGSIGLFLISLLILGPFVHEIAHVLVLKLASCSYSFSYGFSIFQGVYGSVAPYCQLSRTVLLVFYSAGYLATLTAGSILSVASIETEIRSLSLVTASAGTGMLVSVLLSIGSKGDLQQIISVLEVSQIYGTFTVIFIATGVFITSLRTIEYIFRLEREE